MVEKYGKGAGGPREAEGGKPRSGRVDVNCYVVDGPRGDMYDWIESRASPKGKKETLEKRKRETPGWGTSDRRFPPASRPVGGGLRAVRQSFCVARFGLVDQLARSLAVGEAIALSVFGFRGGHAGRRRPAGGHEELAWGLTRWAPPTRPARGHAGVDAPPPRRALPAPSPASSGRAGRSALGPWIRARVFVTLPAAGPPSRSARVSSQQKATTRSISRPDLRLRGETSGRSSPSPSDQNGTPTFLRAATRVRAQQRPAMDGVPSSPSSSETLGAHRRAAPCRARRAPVLREDGGRHPRTAKRRRVLFTASCCRRAGFICPPPVGHRRASSRPGGATRPLRRPPRARARNRYEVRHVKRESEPRWGPLQAS